MQNNLSKARLISRALEGSGYFTCLSNIHRPKVPAASVGQTLQNVAGQVEGMVHTKKVLLNEEDGEFYVEGLPVVAFRFSDDFKKQYPHIKQEWIQLQLRSTGWIVPK